MFVAATEKKFIAVQLLDYTNEKNFNFRVIY